MNLNSRFAQWSSVNVASLPRGRALPVLTNPGGERCMGRVAQASSIDISSRSNLLSPSDLPYRHSALESYSKLHKVGSASQLRDVITKCQDAYISYGLVRTFVDVMTEFASEGILITHPSKAGRTFFKGWTKAINFAQFKNQFFLEMFRSENVPVYKIMGQVRRDRLMGLETLTKVPRGIRTVRIPVEYTILNPATIASSSVTFTNSQRPYGVQIPPSIIAAIQKMMRKKDGIIEKLTGPIVEAIQSNKKFVPLDPEYFTMVTRHRQPYEPFAWPSLWSVLDDLSFKMELQTMDRETARTQIRTFGVVNIGDDDDVAGQPEIDAMSELIEQTSSSTYLVTNHTVKISFPAPDVSKILSDAKYAQVDKDIRMGLGISDVIFGGDSGASYANAFLSIRTLVQRIASAREAFFEFFQPEVHTVSRAIGLRQPGQLVMRKIGLRDENVEKRIIVRLVETGVIPPEIAVQALEEGDIPSFGEIREAWERHKQELSEGKFLPLQATMVKESQKEKKPEDEDSGENKKGPKTPRTEEKPPGGTGPQANPRDPAPKPQGMGSSLTETLDRARSVVTAALRQHLHGKLHMPPDDKLLSFVDRITRSLLVTQDEPHNITLLGQRALLFFKNPEEMNGLQTRAERIGTDDKRLGTILGLSK